MDEPASLRVRRLRDDEVTAALDRALVSFGGLQDPQRLEGSLRRRVARGELLGAAERVTDRVLAHAVATTADHWLGGRRVPCQHVRGVAVAPEDRGQGAATALLRAVARSGADSGAGLSLLFPSVDSLYRRLGWEHAGDYAWWRMPCRAAAGVDGPPLRRLAPADWPAVRDCRERFAAGHPAIAVRDDDAWEQLGQARFGWVRDTGGGELDAYALLDHQRKPDDWRHRLALRDWAATSHQGLSAIVGLLGRHGSTAVDATFRGPIPHPFQLVVAEQELSLDAHMQWMARGLDLPAAVGACGFPAAVRTEVTIEIADEVLDAAIGPWRLSVGDGRAALRPADRPCDVRLDATAVGPLVTGHRSAQQLALVGRADGDEAALAALSAAFAGPAPHLTDFF